MRYQIRLCSTILVHPSKMKLVFGLLSNRYLLRWACTMSKNLQHCPSQRMFQLLPGLWTSAAPAGLKLFHTVVLRLYKQQFQFVKLLKSPLVRIFQELEAYRTIQQYLPKTNSHWSIQSKFWLVLTFMGINASSLNLLTRLRILSFLFTSIILSVQTVRWWLTICPADDGDSRSDFGSL